MEPLTREKILAMLAGPEMDCYIAMLGYLGVYLDGSYAREGYMRLSPDGALAEVPQYSSSLTLAMQVFDGFDGAALTHNWRSPHPYQCSIVLPPIRLAESWLSERDVTAFSFRSVCATAETIPLAVCRAALLTTIKETA